MIACGYAFVFGKAHPDSFTWEWTAAVSTVAPSQQWLRIHEQLENGRPWFLLGAFYYAMTTITIPILCATDLKTLKTITYPVRGRSTGYAFHMTRGGKRWFHVETANHWLEHFDAQLHHHAQNMREKWRIVDITTGKIVKTNVREDYVGTPFVISEEVLNMGKPWKHVHN